MRHWAKLLGGVGRVEILDYPYMLEHRKRPDALPQLIAAHREAFTRAKRKFRGPVILIGKSGATTEATEAGQEARDDAELIRCIVTGEHLHVELCAIAARYGASRARPLSAAICAPKRNSAR